MKKLIVPATIAAILIGCSTTKPPTKTEQALFDIHTNYYPVIVVQTNLVTLTNTVVQTVQVTNQVGVIIPTFVTNTYVVPVTQIQTQIVQTLADKCEVTKKVGKSLLDTLAQIAVSEVKKNGVFIMPGIGRLVRVERKARIGRNTSSASDS